MIMLNSGKGGFRAIFFDKNLKLNIMFWEKAVRGKSMMNYKKIPLVRHLRGNVLAAVTPAETV